jgi:trehalose/maltose hydrolase-like predicted phosphorylase
VPVAVSGPDRTFEAIVFDWDGTAVPDRGADATPVRERVEALCAAGVHVAVVSGTHVGNIDGQLKARPAGPGSLHLCLNRGSEVFSVDRDGPSLVWRRVATPEEDAALDRAAAAVVAVLAERGLAVEVVSSRLNRRKIDLIPEPAWRDPPKARIAELLDAVRTRLAAAGIGDLGEVVALALGAARQAGLADPRVTSDVKHVEIGLTDKSDSMRWVLAALWRWGIGPGLVLVAGDEFGPLGGVRGSDAHLLVPEAARAVAVSVGVEPAGVPPGVVHLPGGPARFLGLLDAQLARRAARRVPWIDEDPAWVVSLPVASGRPRVRESLATLANGRVGVRGALEEDGPGASPLVAAAGVWTGRDAPVLLPGPLWTGLARLAPAVAGGVDRQVLDLRTGVLARERAVAGGTVRSVRFVSLADPDAAGLRVEAPVGGLDPGAAVVVPPDAPRAEVKAAGGAHWARTRSTVGGGIAVAAHQRGGRADGIEVVERVVALGSDGLHLPRRAELARRLARLDASGFDALLARHRAAWAERWATAEVCVVGDPDLELALRFALFHLMASVATEGEAAIGARGMTGPAYGGHVFWDADVFVLPVLAATCPAGARAMLEYRLRRLPAARRAAAERGLAGARFPWESATDGTDVTPRFGIDQTGRRVPIRTGDHEEHVTADVAWAAWTYAAWSGDQAFLEGPGRALVTDTARYWASRVRRDAAGRAHIYGVIGPDEYHEVVDDNAFTNVMARWNLRRAAELVDRTGTAAEREEAAAWRDLADALVDGYDPATGRYEQFAGFWSLEPLLIAEVAEPPVAADVLLGRERVQGAQVIKQADVLMLHAMVPEEVAPGSVAPNLDFYGPRTAHGSSLSPAVHAGLLAQVGRPDEALALFSLAARLDLDDLTGTTAAGLHLATFGGLWQAFVGGFLGVRPEGDVLRVAPRLPAAWQAASVRIVFRGVGLEVRADHGGVTISAAGPVAVAVGSGPRVALGPGRHRFESGGR